MSQTISNSEGTLKTMEPQLKNWLKDAIKDYYKNPTSTKEWLNITEACDYIGISYNTFKKYPAMGLKICEIDGVKRVSKSEIDKFLNKFSY